MFLSRDLIYSSLIEKHKMLACFSGMFCVAIFGLMLKQKFQPFLWLISIVLNFLNSCNLRIHVRKSSSRNAGCKEAANIFPTLCSHAIINSFTGICSEKKKSQNNCKVYVQVLTSINIIRNHSSHKRSHLEALYPCFLWKDKEQHTVTLQVWERPVLDIINFCRNKCNWWRIVPMTSPNYLTISNIGACVAKWPDLGFEIWSSRVQVPL